METLFNSPDKFKTKFVNVDGYNTHYIEAGEDNRDSILLVHGSANYTGLGCFRWFPNIIPLSERFHVYAIDELGHGQTDPPRNLKELGHIRVRAEHVIHFIETLGLAPINLAGQSQGGWIVTYITLKRPELVSKLIIIDSGSTAGSNVKTGEETAKTIDVNGVQVKVDGSGELPYMKKLFEPGTMLVKSEINLKSREGVRKLREPFHYDRSMLTDEFLDHILEMSEKWSDLYLNHQKEFYRKHTIQDHKKMYFIDGVHIRELVKNIQVPTLVMWGKNSNKGIDPGVELYKRIPDAQMHIFDRASHYVWTDQWRDFNSLVTWFLTKDR